MYKDMPDRFAVVERLKQVHSPVAEGPGDRAYDCGNCYEPIHHKRAKSIAPPEQRAVLHKDACMKRHNQNIMQISRLGLEKWEKKICYHRRSLEETAFYRLKKIFSDRLGSKRADLHDVEMIRCEALNIYAIKLAPQPLSPGSLLGGRS